MHGFQVMRQPSTRQPQMYRGLSHCVPPEPLRLKEGKSQGCEVDL